MKGSDNIESCSRIKLIEVMTGEAFSTLMPMACRYIFNAIINPNGKAIATTQANIRAISKLSLSGKRN